MYFEYRSIADLNQCIFEKLYFLPKDIDLIVGIPRSGMLPANLMALYLNKPFTDIDSFIEGKIYSSGERGKKIDSVHYKHILVVDDSLTTGNAILKAKKKTEVVSDKYHLRYAVVYATTTSRHLVDFYFEIIDSYRFFQWNLFHYSFIMENCCCCLDGVLCLEPPVVPDDPRYAAYLSEAIPFHLPTVKIGVLISDRPEKYREITIEWLCKYNIRYNRLFFLNQPDLPVVGKKPTYACQKADIYAQSSAILFVENTFAQAQLIQSKTGKPVFCMKNFILINSKREKVKSFFLLKIKNTLPVALLQKCYAMRQLVRSLFGRE